MLPEPIRIRAKVRDGLVEALVLMPHPMETGLRKDESGNFIPAHFITEVQATVSGRTVLEARMSLAVSRDPLLSFRFRGAQAGERLRVHWVDNTGAARSDEAPIT